MKKSVIICAGLCVALAFASCSPKESMYKKAYEKAKASETNAMAVAEEQVITTPVVTPLVETPATRTTVVADNSNVSVRTEELSVVVGSFGLKANAEGLSRKLRAAGYEARIAYNSAINMYRVVASSFNAKSDAVNSRDQLRGEYPDAWLLFQK